MPRRILSLALLIVPAVGLAALGFAIVAAAGPRPGPPGLGAGPHFAVRQAAAAVLGAALGWVVARAGIERLLRAAPVLFAGALVATCAVFVPGIGVRAAGASRWLHLGPLSGNPAPFLIGATGLLVAAWIRRRSAADRGPVHRFESRPFALLLALVAIFVLIAEPDFSSAAVVLAVTFAALAGTGVAGRRLAPAAAVLLVALAIGASRFGYVGGRVHGFLSPESDRRGRGFEVLELARARAIGAAGPAGFGHGAARRHLSSPASDYVFAIVNEELGRPGAWGVVGAWVAIAAGAALAIRSAPADARRRGCAAACATALLAPAALHIAVCRGWIPIVGVTMPFLSYDPTLTFASGGEIGALAAIAFARDPAPAPAPTAAGEGSFA